MKQKWIGDGGLQIRMLITIFLLGAVYVFFLAALWSLGAGAMTMLAFAGAMMAAQYFFSDKMILWSMGAKDVTPEQAPDLHAMVERLAAMADMPKPRIAMVEHSMANAFATGRDPKHAVVAVTTGLIQQLNRDELEAVLAHELSHVKNRDVMVITLASFFSTLAFMIMRFGMYMGLFGGFGGRGRDNQGNAIILVYFVAVLVWIVSFLLIRALSRYREYSADRGAAVLTGSPSHLSSALLKISGRMQRIPKDDLRQVEGANAFFIMPAVGKNSLMELISTHPSLENRLKRLAALEQQMEQA